MKSIEALKEAYRIGRRVGEFEHQREVTVFTSIAYMDISHAAERLSQPVQGYGQLRKLAFAFGKWNGYWDSAEEWASMTKDWTIDDKLAHWGLGRNRY